jgi:hypothetical protein
MVADVLAKVLALPYDWHGAGTATNRVLGAIDAQRLRPLLHSAETGTARTTLLFSHASRDHLVFTIDDDGHGDTLERVRGSSVLAVDTTRFIVGPAQLTLPRQTFTDALDLVLLDGPHAFPYPCLEYLYFAPRVRTGGLLVVDDIHIPAVRILAALLRKDAMWRCRTVVDHTRFYARTPAVAHDPLGDGWWLRGHNRASAPRATLTSTKARAARRLKQAWRAGRGDDMHSNGGP